LLSCAAFNRDLRGWRRRQRTSWPGGWSPRPKWSLGTTAGGWSVLRKSPAFTTAAPIARQVPAKASDRCWRTFSCWRGNFGPETAGVEIRCDHTPPARIVARRPRRGAAGPENNTPSPASRRQRGIAGGLAGRGTGPAQRRGGALWARVGGNRTVPATRQTTGARGPGVAAHRHAGRRRAVAARDPVPKGMGVGAAPPLVGRVWESHFTARGFGKLPAFWRLT